MSGGEFPEVRGYGRWRVALSAAIGVAVALLLAWWASGFAVFHEELFRVAPTIEGGGIGSNWVEGNEIGYLGALIKLVHFADVVMGVFIVFIFVIHWGSFRRLAARMRRSGAVTDGGSDREEGGDSP